VTVEQLATAMHAVFCGPSEHDRRFDRDDARAVIDHIRGTAGNPGAGFAPRVRPVPAPAVRAPAVPR
jgi:hypothetical protein